MLLTPAKVTRHVCDEFMYKDEVGFHGSCFYGTPGLGKTTVRFAFAKKLETLDAAVARLRAYHD